MASGAAFDDDTFKSCISFNAEVVDHGARFIVFPRMRRQCGAPSCLSLLLASDVPCCALVQRWRSIDGASFFSLFSFAATKLLFGMFGKLIDEEEIYHQPRRPRRPIPAECAGSIYFSWDECDAPSIRTNLFDGGRCFGWTMHFRYDRRRCVSDEFLTNTKIPVGQFLRNMIGEYVGSGCEVMLRRDSNYSFQLELL